MEDTISFLLVQVAKAHRNLANDLLRKAFHKELYAGQDMVLHFLKQHDGCSQSELATSLCVEAPTVTRMIERMGEKGLVERHSDQEDARVMRVYLTPKGSDYESRIAGVWDQMEAQAVASFTLEERVLFRRLLMQMAENLSENLH